MKDKQLHVRQSSPLIAGFLRLAADPEMGRWLMEDAHRFAAFHAALSVRVEWPDALAGALPGKGAIGRVSINDRAFTAWKRRNDHPFQGRISPLYLQAFWMGLRCHETVVEHPALWQEALRALSVEFPPVRTVDAGLPFIKPAGLAGLKSPSTRLPDRNALTVFALNLGLFLPFISLSAIEQEVLELSFLLTEDESVRLFFDLLATDPRHLLMGMPVFFGMSFSEWESMTGPEGVLSLGRLVSFHPQSRRVLPMSTFWHGWFTTLATSVSSMHCKLVVPLRTKSSSGAMGRVRSEDEDIIRRIFCAPRRSGKEGLGINALLYGSKSIDKLGWVADRLAAWNKTAYTLAPDIPDEDMASVCFFAQRYLDALDSQAVLVVPRADNVLTRTRRGQHSFLFLTIEIDDEESDSESERLLVEGSPVPGIWLTSSADRLSEENIGRFLYVCEMRGASRSDRREEVAGALDGLGFSDDFHAEIAQHTQLGARQLKNAARMALLLHRGWDSGVPSPDVCEARQQLVRQVVEQGQKALGRRQREVLRPSVTQYSLDFLNTSGAFSIPQIIQALRHRPSGTLCFWGIPGTGKTQLAEHIAVAIDKPIIIKRASDLLGMYVGENEKHIRAMFGEAAEEDAILLLDEADTFLRDRRYARSSWEVSMVNEILQGMERFPGVFICATNLFDSLDAAALRRFTFKVEFRALNEEQAWRMFINETGLDPVEMAASEIERWKMELILLRSLTPGDFATVQRTRQLLGVDLTPQQWFDALKNEVSAKMRAAEATHRSLIGSPSHAMPE